MNLSYIHSDEVDTYKKIMSSFMHDTKSRDLDKFAKPFMQIFGSEISIHKVLNKSRLSNPFNSSRSSRTQLILACFVNVKNIAQVQPRASILYDFCGLYKHLSREGITKMSDVLLRGAILELDREDFFMGIWGIKN